MTADFLNSVREVFGKPAAVLVTSGNEIILQHGELMPKRMRWDGGAR